MDMDLLIILLLLGLAAQAVKRAEQRQRIALLGEQLQKFQIEKLMEQLTGGYLRALGESDPERSEPIWRMLESTEHRLAAQLKQLALDLARLGEAPTRVSRLPVALPLAGRLWPTTHFDLRPLVALHAEGFAHGLTAVAGQSRKAQAFMLSAELFLFQHSCHWFCRSKTVASARLLARHKSSHAQVLAAVSPLTRKAYVALTSA
jgi:hypothetical protein